MDGCDKFSNFLIIICSGFTLMVVGGRWLDCFGDDFQDNFVMVVLSSDVFCHILYHFLKECFTENVCGLLSNGLY